MIYLTVGTQLPFTRLTRWVDKWKEDNPSEDVFGQIGKDPYKPKNFSFKAKLTLDEAERYFRDCSLVIAHAGMGSILSALTNSKPIIIVPRLFVLQEHRNDHQLATAGKLRSKKGVFIANTYEELKSCIDTARENCSFERMPEFASSSLLDNISRWIES